MSSSRLWWLVMVVAVLGVAAGGSIGNRIADQVMYPEPETAMATPTFVVVPTSTTVVTPTPEPTLPPPVLVSFTPVPTPMPTAIVLPTSTPLPTVVPVTGTASPHLYDSVQLSIYERFAAYGEDVGHLFVRISFFEGYSGNSRPGCNWSVSCISSSGDACPLQINQIHDDNPRSAIRVIFGDNARWPDPVLNLSGCLAVSEYLYSIDGVNPWKKSRLNCSDQGCSGWASDQSITNSTGEVIPR